MTQTTLDETISRLEREMSDTSGQEKAEAAERLRALLKSKEPTKTDASEDEDDLFDNMPI
ncbi:MAG: hypothetical protein ACSHWS_11385 [Sulfitobacter sp.]